ncbi:MAG: HD-GYP domain-containing protein [Spirochaetaceae bacterium]|nr:HD-GYP domain-containing protein [Spirochaetaceae bacterium]MBQ8353384.1 HD-GYP domain-containing protein [Spirochaetaceae bacterium]
MNSFNIEGLKPGTFFTSDVMLDKTFLLLTNSIPLSEGMIKALQDWDFKQVFSDGTLSSSAIATNISQNTTDIDIEELENSVNSPKSNVTTEKFSAEELNAAKKALENAETIDIDDIGNEPKIDTEASRLSVVTNIYNDYLNYISYVYTRYATHKELNYEELSSKVKDLCVFIKENRRFVLRILQSTQEPKAKEFLVSHSMRSTVYAITIGMQLRLPLSNLVELGVSCIVHEIGMIRLPPQLYMTERALNASDKKMIFTHPIISYNILQEFEFPLKVCLGALEHHERENGTGYPNHLPSEKISIYAKIIAVACSFEAITAPRHYKDAQSSYEAMVDMLKNNKQFYDENVIKALLYSLSLFPIGGYVYLSNGKIAQVVDVNPENPKNPVVQLVSTVKGAKQDTIQTSDTGIRIVRALNKEECNDVIKAQTQL